MSFCLLDRFNLFCDKYYSIFKDLYSFYRKIINLSKLNVTVRSRISKELFFVGLSSY